MRNIRYASILYFLLLLLNQQTRAQDLPVFESVRISLTLTGQPLSVILREMRYQSQGYQYSLLSDPGKTFDIEVSQWSIPEVLNALLEREHYKWELRNNTVVIWELPDSAVAPTTRYNNNNGPPRKWVYQGSVTGENLKPLNGATVILKGTRFGTVANETGNFKFTATDSTGTLLISFVGYESVSIPVVSFKQTDVQLKVANNSLDSAFAITYSTTSRRLATGNVSSVTAGIINKSPADNIASVMQGRIPGLNIVQPSGVPGASFKSLLRGRSSVLNVGEPLVIVNGVQLNIQSLNQYASIIGKNTGVGAGPLITLNPDQIESVQIYKDAAATAIYGSRGANGVIDIKMKKGTTDELTVTANLSRGISGKTHELRLLNTKQYIALRREAFKNDGITPNDIPGTDGYAPDLADTTRYTDWQETLTDNTATVTNANISLSTGNDRVKFYMGIGYLDQSTVFSKAMDYKRLSVSSSLQYLSKNEKLRFNTFCYWSANANRLYDGDFSAIFLPPNTPPVYDNGHNLNWSGWTDWGQIPEAARMRSYKMDINNLILSATPKFVLSKHLSIRTNMGYNGIFVNETLAVPKASQNPISSDTLAGTSSFGRNILNNFIVEPMVEYYQRNFTLLLGSTFQYSKGTAFSHIGHGYNNDNILPTPDSAAYFSDTTRGRNEYKYGSFFAQADYNISDRYIFHLIYRRDGSSRFSPEKRFGNFWAVGAAWVFSDEPFMRSLKHVINYSKIRASYGLTGNDQIGDYKYIERWEPLTNGLYPNTRGMSPQSLYNPEYSWEQNHKTEVALDFQLLNGRVSGNIAYFYNRSDKQLVEFDLPRQTGFKSVLRNFNAQIENSGFEVMTDAILVQNKSFGLSTGVNLSIPKSKLRHFEGLSSSDYAATFIVGRSINAVNGYEWLGIDKNTGLHNLKDQNGDGVLNDADRVYIGHVDPKFQGGIEIAMNYKRFSLSLFAEFKKITVYSDTYNAIIGGMRAGGMSNQLELTEDRWRQPGDDAAYPKASTKPTSAIFPNSSFVAASSRAYTDGSFIKLRNLYFDYTIRNDRLANARIDEIRLFLKGQNLLTLSKYKAGDPETANLLALPTLRTIAVGIELKLKEHSKKKQ